MRVSIKDIARAAGVSHSTVSRALNDSVLVSERTRSHIQLLARQMGYSPDTLARSLVTRHSRSVGVVVTTITDPFMAEVVQGIQLTATDYDYTVILCGSDELPEREMAAVEMLRSKRVDGVISVASRIGARYLDYRERIDAPVVIINNHSEQLGRYPFTVSVDNRHGGYLAGQHLIKQGHRRTGYVTGPVAVTHSSSHDRMAGYQAAQVEAGLEPRLDLVVQGNGCPDSGVAALCAYMQMQTPPSAVFCYNDMTALGVMHAARQAGMSIPDDLAVVGYDDIPLAAYLAPPLTSIAQPTRQMGQRAMRLVLALIDGSEERALEMTATPDWLVQCHLVARASTKGTGDKDST